MKPSLTNAVVTAAGALAAVALLWTRRNHRDNECRRSMKGKSLISINDLNADQILYIMKLAKHFKVVRDARNCKSKCRFANWFYGMCSRFYPRPLVVGLMFMEPSTRTRCSFEAAAKRLGCATVTICDASTASTAKGETAEDTARMLQGYCDALVVRHPEKGVLSRIQQQLPQAFPVINAGNGSEEHPTQALLDLFAIEQEFPGRLNNWKEQPLVVTLMGDLLHGRTVHSLARLLVKFNTQLQFFAPDGLGFPSSALDELDLIANNAKVIFPRYSAVNSVVEALRSSDVVYATRIQTERFQEQNLPHSFTNDFVLTSDLIDAHSPKHQIILHPLPRMNEIDVSVDSNPRQRYFGQAADGMFVRMALLSASLSI